VFIKQLGHKGEKDRKWLEKLDKGSKCNSPESKDKKYGPAQPFSIGDIYPPNG